MSSIVVPTIRESDLKGPTTPTSQPEQTVRTNSVNGKEPQISPQVRKYRKLPRNTLPSKLAIPVGLAQVFTGISMVVLGAFSLKYQSYLFFYSSGLWAGTIAGICGIFAILSTKKGIQLPQMCGGPKYQVHAFLGSTLLAMSAAVLLFVLSTSGLLQSTIKPVGVELETLNKDDETYEKRRSSGTAINAILLLLSLLQILLSFMSLGISIRVLCVVPSSRLLSSESQNGDILRTGSGREHIEKKHRLMHWLGYQRIPLPPSPQIPPNKKPLSSVSLSEYTAGAPNFMTALRMARARAPPPPPTLVPMHYGVPMMHHPPPHIIPYLEILSPRPPPPNYPIFYPICQPTNMTLPHRRSLTQLVSSGAASSVASTSTCSAHRPHKNRQRSSGSSRSSEPETQSRGTSAPQSIVGSEGDVASNKEIEATVTEEEVSHSYSGLDRALAEDFISNSMTKSSNPNQQ